MINNKLTCKCGHNIKRHGIDNGLCVGEVGNTCACKKTQNDLYEEKIVFLGSEVKRLTSQNHKLSHAMTDILNILAEELEDTEYNSDHDRMSSVVRMIRCVQEEE